MWYVHFSNKMIVEHPPVTEHLNGPHFVLSWMCHKHTIFLCRKFLVLLLGGKSFKESCGEAACPL